MHSSKPLVIVLIGPTASGKTELAIEIAKYFKINIHNIDSRQIYKGMDIGTAKPTNEQQNMIQHFLINLTSPDRKITVKEFQDIATNSINNELERGSNPFLVGGSGLYMNSIIKGFITPKVPPQKLFRNQLSELGQKKCWELLKSCDQITACKINSEDTIRTIRALEVFYATGKPISSQQSSIPPPWKILELGLDREDLQKRISSRTQNIFNNGIIDETKILINKYGSELSLLKTIGYEEAKNVLNQIYNEKDAIEITTKKTINFAKRQRTWFRNKNNPHWLDTKNPLKDAIIKIESAIC
tara:strand:+ start:1109 stop:2008 length:900 start_codon:yes stop_codon:yes gene_type:complete